MTDIIRRAWAVISNGARPIDWLVLSVDFAVLLVIVYDAVLGGIRHRRDKERQKFLHSRKEDIHGFIKHGTALLMSIPRPAPPADAQQYEQAKTKWVAAVYSWSSETEASLSALSANARSTFLSSVNLTNPAEAIFLPDGTTFWEGDYRIRNAYQMLVNKIAHLQTIMGNPEAYF